MSERLQYTAASMREKMLQRYGDVLHHKHDKNHNPYRQHCRSHPVQKRIDGLDGEHEVHCSTGQVREWRLRKFCKRVAKGQIH